MGITKQKTIKIVVTGANGQLGKCIQDIAVQYSDYDFHFKSSKELDITSKSQINSLFTQEKFGYCINCAAYTAVDKAESDQENAFLVNAEAVRYLAEACKAQNTILIHISTDFVFDGSKTTPYSEEDVPNPINVYGASKLKGEQYVQQLLKKYFIIRTSWVYSEYGHNFVKTMLRLGKESKEISVVNDQIGSPTYAGDLAGIIMKVVDSKESSYGLFHYSYEGEISWFDFATSIFEIKRMNVKVKPIPSEAFPTLAKRPRFSVMDKSKITQALNLKIPYWRDSLEKGIFIINN